MKKALLKKGILLVSSVLLLTAVIIYITTAWFTKNVSISGVSFDVAQWDFNAVYQVDTATVNVFTYTNLTEGKAAPGTEGWIPVDIDASASDTDVNYVIELDEGSMSQEFQDRLTFYYETTNASGSAIRVPFDDDHFLTGSVEKKSKTQEIIYWEWVYEMPEDYAEGKSKSASELSSEWDEFDTKVGKNPAAYEPLMNATIKVYGSQADPTREVEETTPAAISGDVPTE